MILQCACTHGSTKATGFPFAHIRIFLGISVKVVTIEGTSGKKQDTELILLTFILESERVLCTGVGVVIVYLYCVGGTWLKCINSGI
jgi:hypothetical protein